MGIIQVFKYLWPGSVYIHHRLLKSELHAERAGSQARGPLARNRLAQYVLLNYCKDSQVSQ